jgi:hypothetical protein
MSAVNGFPPRSRSDDNMTTRRRWAMWALALIPAAMVLAQVPPDEAARLLEEMKQRDALARADRLERRLTEAQKEIDRLQGELASAQVALSQAKAAAEASAARIRHLEDQLAFTGISRSHALDGSLDAVPEVTARQLQIVGERFVGRQVKLSDCSFATVHGNYTNIVPDVEPLTDDRWQILRQSHAEKWIGLIFTDAGGHHYFHAYAPKDRFADFLLGLARGTRLNIAGVIAPMLSPDADSQDRHVLICESIVPAP